MKRFLHHLAAIGLILVLEPTALSVSALSCGATITTNTVLKADLSCDCSKKPIYLLLLKGPATLDLNGKTIRCTVWDPAFETACIQMSGKGGTIKNGILRKCDSGIATRGTVVEGALIQNVIAKETYYEGFSIDGTNNLLRNVTASPDGEYGIGIRISGKNNRVSKSKAINAKSIGITLYGNNNTVVSSTIRDVGGSCATSSGKDNVFDGNTMLRCGGHGVEIEGNSTKITDNTIETTGKTSVMVAIIDNVHGVSGIKISGNRISNSRGSGIAINSSFKKTLIDKNAISNCATHGIVLFSQSTSSTVQTNTIQECGMTGLYIFGSTDNAITKNSISKCKVGIEANKASKRNRITSNLVSGSSLIALRDLSVMCGSNVWKGNSGKGNLPCTMAQ